VYEGGKLSFREVVELRPDGTFNHELFDGVRSIYSESGRWSIPPGRYEIRVDSFTEFYDRLARNFAAQAKKYVAYQFFPLPEGKTFRKISACVDFEYCLLRKKTL